MLVGDVYKSGRRCGLLPPECWLSVVVELKVELEAVPFVLCRPQMPSGFGPPAANTIRGCPTNSKFAYLPSFGRLSVAPQATDHTCQKLDQEQQQQRGSRGAAKVSTHVCNAVRDSGFVGHPVGSAKWRS